MPRVVRDVIRMTRTFHPPDTVSVLPIAPDGEAAVPQAENQSATNQQTPILVEWQVLVLIHVLPDSALF